MCSGDTVNEILALLFVSFAISETLLQRRTFGTQPEDSPSTITEPNNTKLPESMFLLQRLGTSRDFGVTLLF